MWACKRDGDFHQGRFVPASAMNEWMFHQENKWSLNETNCGIIATRTGKCSASNARYWQKDGLKNGCADQVH